MKSYQSKFRAFQVLLERMVLSCEAETVVKHMLENRSLVERCVFVPNADHTPRSLVFYEAGGALSVSLFVFSKDCKTPINYEATQEVLQGRSNRYIEFLAEGGTLTVTHGPNEINDALDEILDEVYVSILTPNAPVANELCDVYETNPWALQEPRKSEQLQKAMYRRLQSAIDAEIRIAIGGQELEKALAARDYERCRQLKRTLEQDLRYALREKEFKRDLLRGVADL